MRTLKKNLYRLEFLQKLHLMKMLGYGNKIAQKKQSCFWKLTRSKFFCHLPGRIVEIVSE